MRYSCSCTSGAAKEAAKRLQKGCKRAAERLQKGCGKAAKRLQKVCKRTAERLQKGCRKAAERLQKGCSCLWAAADVIRQLDVTEMHSSIVHKAMSSLKMSES